MKRGVSGIVVGLGTAAAMVICGSAAAQTSELYLTEWSTTDVYVVQNGSIVRQFNRSSTADGPGLVVTDSVKCIGQDPGNEGRQYGLDGTPMAGRYPNPGFDSLYDGATDGVHNWSVAHNDFDVDFAVVQGDADWGGLSVLFVPQRRSSGIAYDANNGTLWLANNSGGTDRVQQYDLAGNLLSEFTAIHSGGGYGLAWDPADDTLWIPGAFGTAGQLFQYDKSGNLLDTVNIPQLQNILGAEFGGEAQACLDMTVSTLTGGQQATWSISGADPNTRVVVVYGFAEGQTVINGTAGYCATFGIRGVNQSKVICQKNADANGELSCNKLIPGNATGKRVLTQAAMRGTCPKECMSDVDDQVVQ